MPLTPVNNDPLFLILLLNAFVIGIIPGIFVTLANSPATVCDLVMTWINSLIMPGI